MKAEVREGEVVGAVHLQVCEYKVYLYRNGTWQPSCKLSSAPCILGYDLDKYDFIEPLCELIARVDGFLFRLDRRLVVVDGKRKQLHKSPFLVV